jgi:predicted nucleic acid-binding protein
VAITLIDSSSWIEALRRTGDQTVRARVQTLVDNGEAAWCDIVRLELWNSAAGEWEQKVLRQFERDLPCLAVTAEVWEAAIDLARRTRAAGLSVPNTDLLIFACADYHNVPLEHHDEHFSRLAKR